MSVLNVRLIPLDEIDDESLIREANTEDEHFLALKKHMERTGRCPGGHVEVRPNGDLYTLIDGAHRTMAAHMLGWEKIPCLIREDVQDEVQAKEEALATFNKVPPKPTDLGRALAEIKESRGCDLTELGQRVGMTPNQIRMRLKLKKLDGRAGELVDKGAIPLTVGTYLAKLQKHGINPNEVEGLLDRCATETADDVIPEIKALIKGRRPARKFKGRPKRQVVEFYEAIEKNPDFSDEFKRGILWALGED